MSDKYEVFCPHCTGYDSYSFDDEWGDFEEERHCTTCGENFVALVTTTIEYVAEGITCAAYSKLLEEKEAKHQETVKRMEENAKREDL